jgi:hypothetical protein
VCERLHLRLARSCVSDRNPPGASRSNTRRHRPAKNS